MSIGLKDQVITLLRNVCQVEHIPLPLDVDETTDLVSLGLNSLLFIKFVVRMEIEFDIDFDDENMDLSRFVLIKDIVAYVEEQRGVVEEH